MSAGAEEGFKVTDRRHRDPGEAPSPTTPSPPAPGEREAPTLSGLFVMLATEALIALGEAPDPLSGQPARNLPHAARAIDLLVLLRDKTVGNRSADETRLLDELLYDLQLRYVGAAKSRG